MAKLILVDAEKASVYSLPQKDTTDEECVRILKEMGFDPKLAKTHIADAIASGAYRRVEREAREAKGES